MKRSLFVVLALLLVWAPAGAQEKERMVLLKFNIEPPQARDALIYLWGRPEDMKSEHPIAANDENGDGIGEDVPIAVEADKYPGGRVTYSLRRKGFRDYNGTLSAPNAFLNPTGELVPVEVNLEPVGRNYLGLGLAVGGALALGGGVLFLRSRKRSEGDIRKWVETNKVPTGDTVVGKLFSDYWILEKLGHGGMASVYKARVNRLDTEEIVAVKLVHPHLAGGEDFQARFRREVEVGSKLIHPNIITVLAAGEEEGKFFMVLEYVEGSELRSLIPAEGFDLEEGLEYILPIFGAVGYAHKKGVVHRDIKPDNILVKKDGTIKLSDFGLARTGEFSTVTATGAVVGTPAYMSPEQLKGKAVECPTDQYALGVVVFQLLTGRLPFEDEEVLQLVLKHLTQEPPRPSSLKPELPAALDEVVLRMLKKDPEERFPDVGEAAEALRRLL